MRARVIASFLPCSMVDTCRVAPAECRSKSSSRAINGAVSHATPRRAAPRRATPNHVVPRCAAPRHAARCRATSHCAQPGYSAPRRHRSTAISKKTTRPLSKPREPRPFPSVCSTDRKSKPGSSRRDTDEIWKIQRQLISAVRNSMVMKRREAFVTGNAGFCLGFIIYRDIVSEVGIFGDIL